MSMEDDLDALGRALFGRTRTEAHKQNICVKCGKDASVLPDKISQAEYKLSGLCYMCQADIFGRGE